MKHLLGAFVVIFINSSFAAQSPEKAQHSSFSLQTYLLWEANLFLSQIRSDRKNVQAWISLIKNSGQLELLAQSGDFNESIASRIREISLELNTRFTENIKVKSKPRKPKNAAGPRKKHRKKKGALS